MNLLGILAAVAMFLISSPAQAMECPSSAVLYYSPACWHSQQLIDSLDQMNIKLPMKDVSADSEAKEYLRVNGGLMQVPCLFIDGKPLYNDEEIMKWIKANTDCLKQLYGMQRRMNTEKKLNCAA